MTGVHLSLDGAVAGITLDNPSKLNAFTRPMLRQLDEACATLETSPGVRCVLILAAEARAFCAGADITAWGELSPTDFARLWVRDGHRVFDRLARLPMPTIAVLEAHAFGGGLELAACADMRIMAPRATLTLPEAQVGIVPGWGGCTRLLRLLPEPMVKEMALFGRRIDATRAAAAGFATVSDTPRSTAEEIAATTITASPRAQEIAKYQIHAAVGEDRNAMIEALGGGMAGATGDRDEGVAAFTEKRTAEFRGN
ncbi:enoyl-CoA hydratase/isomerase family protein [Gymnodinialimonas ceratoperidinii]|uniref:Enoyl-CoA hydratase/isomerase family protein n=1 Tax=Gymnodinialimonas ceratoperidinii TaxID=2856823 RepID=A0A8F6TYK4_9RHOB|nr:enoyl-CoA hydratase/isomerase family protein [Gymnodinialimonas ceratoperidinii]QXT40308.1 enoyl-CoA hydratase/isomerase family protein [Gymnodinialimonas ceratoperidinii]